MKGFHALILILICSLQCAAASLVSGDDVPSLQGETFTGTKVEFPGLLKEK